MSTDCAKLLTVLEEIKSQNEEKLSLIKKIENLQASFKEYPKIDDKIVQSLIAVFTSFKAELQDGNDIIIGIDDQYQDDLK